MNSSYYCLKTLTLQFYKCYISESTIARGLKLNQLIDGTESIRTQVNSYLSQFVLILVNSYSVFGQFVLIFLNLVNSYSFWSIRTQFGQFVLIPKI